jgi:hypothetical protein
MKLQVPLLFAFVVFGRSLLFGDIIYFKDGSALVVQKVWEEGNEVKYRTASGIHAVPRAAVKRFQTQNARPADPSHNQPPAATVIRGTGAPPPKAASVKTNEVVRPLTEDVRLKARSSRFKDSTGYQEALRQQQSSGKPIALYFYVDWCRYCAQLDRSVLSQTEVRQYLDANTLYVSVNPEHGKAESELFARFNGTGFPTFLMLGKDRPVYQVPTAVSPSIFIEACKSAIQYGSNK